MKEIIGQFIDDFHERRQPELVSRDARLPEVQGKANVVMGMRRTGKTFFCYQKIQNLLTTGVELDRILYLNFEDERLLDFALADFQGILDVYYGRYPQNRGRLCYFFFDEIQRIDQWELFIRRVLDTLEVRIVLTGSSSKLLSSEIATTLRGRSLASEIFPYNFQEYLRAHGYFDHCPERFGAHVSSLLRKAVAEYLETGGFPEVQALERNLRIEVLQSYIDTVLLKDVVERYGVSNVVALKHLVRHIMHQPCGKFSVNRFYNMLRSMAVKCTKNSLYEYLDHLVDAYLFYKVPIHSRSEKSRLVNPVKMYTIDTGLLNAMTFRNAANKGPLLENMVFMHLRRCGYDIEYLVTKDGFEVDFLARHRLSGEIKLIQTCWDMSSKGTFEREFRALRSGMLECSVDSATIVTWDDETTLENKVRVVPVWKWLLTEGR
jgi:predicted AAA+ superfamily ATPase